MQLDLKGLGWPAVTLDNHFLANSQQGYRGNAGDIGAYNPQKAGQLLDQVGWKLSGKTRVRNGTPMNLRFVVPAGVGVSDTEAEVTRLMLRRIGVEVTIQTVPFNDFFTKYLIPGNFDITAFSYPSTPYPISNAFDVYAYGETAKGDDMKWYSNLGRTGSREIDQAMYRAGSVDDPSQTADLVNAADELVWRQINVLPLYQTPQNVAVRSTLANIGANGFYDLKYADIGFTS
jgi:peptide/nickel transport system substrate-binding protein